MEKVMEVHSIKFFACSAKRASMIYAWHAGMNSNERFLNKIRLPIKSQTKLKMRRKNKQSRFITRVSMNRTLKTSKKPMYNRFRRQKSLSRSPQRLKINMR